MAKPLTWQNINTSGLGTQAVGYSKLANDAFNKAMDSFNNLGNSLTTRQANIYDEQTTQNTLQYLDQIAAAQAEGDLPTIDPIALRQQYGDQIDIEKITSANFARIPQLRKEAQYQANEAAKAFIRDNVNKDAYALDANNFLRQLRGVNGWDKLSSNEQLAAENLAKTRFGDLRDLDANQINALDSAQNKVDSQLSEIDAREKAELKQYAFANGMGELVASGDNKLGQEFIKNYYKDDPESGVEAMGSVSKVLGFPVSSELFTEIVTSAAEENDKPFLDWSDNDLEEAAQRYIDRVTGGEKGTPLSDKLGSFLRKKREINDRYSGQRNELQGSLNNFRTQMLTNNLIRRGQGQNVAAAQYVPIDLNSYLQPVATSTTLPPDKDKEPKPSNNLEFGELGELGKLNRNTISTAQHNTLVEEGQKLVEKYGKRKKTGRGIGANKLVVNTDAMTKEEKALYEKYQELKSISPKQLKYNEAWAAIRNSKP